MGRNKRQGSSVCYVNPVLLPRRPISEIIALQASRRTVGLLLPRAYGKGRDLSLHHAKLPSGVNLHTYPSCNLPFSPFEWPIPGPSFFRESYRVLKEYDTVHIWAHFYLNNLLLLLMSLFFPRTKVILTMDTLPGYSFRSGRALDALFKLFTWTVGRIVYAVPDTITLYGAALLPHAKRSGIDLRKVRVLPTGVKEHALLPKREAKKRLTAELGVDPATRIVVFVGLLNARKRVGTVLEVARRCHDRDVLFLIVGDGPDRAALETRATRNAGDAPEGRANVRFLGWRSDAPQLINAADVLLFPSAAEGLPGVVMEAMTIGTPVLTTRIPCTTDLITHGAQGLLCAIDDVEEFVRQLRRLLGDARLRERLAAAAKERIGERFSWDTILPQYDSLYDGEKRAESSSRKKKKGAKSVNGRWEEKR